MIFKNNYDLWIRAARRQASGMSAGGKSLVFCGAKVLPPSIKRAEPLEARRRVSASMPPCRPQGLTLIELLVAIGILLLTVSLGAFFVKNQLPKLRLYAGAQELARTLERARRLTVSGQAPHGVKFSLADNNYLLLKLRPFPLALATSTLPENVSFNSTTTPFTDNTAQFNSFGGAKESGTIILQNLDGQTKSVIINPSGYVRVE